MSHPDPAVFDVRTVADHPLIDNGPTSSLRIVAPGSVAAGRYGLFEYRLAPHSPGAEPTSTASFLIHFAPGNARGRFFLEIAELRRSGRTVSPEEMTAFYARHDQVMVDG
jgi:hypothetical protein